MTIVKLPTHFAMIFFIMVATCGTLTNSFHHEGYVLDSATKKPINGVWITLCWQLKVSLVQTDASGHYTIDLDISPESGRVAYVNIEKNGYKSQGVFLNSESYLYPDTIYLEAEKDTVR